MKFGKAQVIRFCVLIYMDSKLIEIGVTQMKRYIIATGTVTYAIKGRDLLRKKGFKVKIERITGKATLGCGYAIILEGNISQAEEILRGAGIKILEIIEKL